MNAWTETNKHIRKYHGKYIRKLSLSGIEVHIIVKSKSTKYDYYCYAEALVGTKEKAKFTDDDDDWAEGTKIYVHIALMPHEGMLTDRFQRAFPKYFKILQDEPWSEIYAGDEEVNIHRLKLSQALSMYITGEEDDSNLPQGDRNSYLQDDYFQDEYFFKFYNKFEKQKSRRRAFVHCIAKKVKALQS